MLLISDFTGGNTSSDAIDPVNGMGLFYETGRRGREILSPDL